MRVTSKSVEKILCQRLTDATYADGLLPSERDLSVEFGVSRPTVHKALQALVLAGKLNRLASGRLQHQGSLCPKLRVGFLVPTLRSSGIDAHYGVLEPLAEELSIRIQPIFYAGWHDPVLSEGCENMDALILVPRPKMPEWLIRKLHAQSKPVLILESDLSALGFPSFTLFPEERIRELPDYLIGLGHRNIDLLNISPLSAEIRIRHEVWRQALDRVGGNGRFRDFGLAEDVLPFREIREIFRLRIQNGAFDFSRVLLCTTMPAAMIFSRAASDCGLTAGVDYSLAVFDGELQAEFHTPAITALERTDPSSYFKTYLEWMRRGGEWTGPMFWGAEKVILQPGESVIIPR